MAADFQYVTGPAVGIYPPSVQSGETTEYFGGSAMAKTAYGLKLAKAGSGDVVVGISKYCRTSDLRNMTAAFHMIPCVVRLYAATQDNDISDPIAFDDTQTYNVGDLIYLDSAGLWTNVAATTDGVFGVVLEVPTGELVVLFGHVIMPFST